MEYSCENTYCPGTYPASSQEAFVCLLRAFAPAPDTLEDGFLSGLGDLISGRPLVRVTPELRIFVRVGTEEKEIEMWPLPKSVFLLYLKHPEGIPADEAPSYEEELLDIYAAVTGRTDREMMRESVRRLTDPKDMQLQVKSSLANRAVLDCFGRADISSPGEAEALVIRSRPGYRKGISLPRRKVKWEK